jgi:2-iminoacetate synthase
MNEAVREYIESIIRPDEIDRYLPDEETDFIDEDLIHQLLAPAPAPDAAHVRDILAKSLAIETLEPHETATLIRVGDPALLAEMQDTALAVKRKVYDNRIVTFAPLYMSNFCVNACAYCGFKADNGAVARRKLTMEEVRRETETLAGKIGHKRLIVVYGEHPTTSTDYIADTIRTVYDTQVKTRRGTGQIRRVNINAAPLPIDDLRILHETGIGTYQVFQETYHHETYRSVHPQNTLKGNYRWRLTCMHRAFEAGIDDVGMGALFGLYDWRFETLALLLHTRELERRFHVGPHTISFPRLEPAENAPITRRSPYRVNDADFRKLVTILRLSVPYTGMIVTARETAELRRAAILSGCTQTDASTRIGIGGYAEAAGTQAMDHQQFMLGDTRSLEELIVDLAQMGMITSFCTAAYRCGRTGGCIMDALKTGKEGKFCKVNAVLTFREWLEDFAGPEAQALCEPLIQKELAAIKRDLPLFYPTVKEYHDRICQGDRDLYF